MGEFIDDGVVRDEAYLEGLASVWRTLYDPRTAKTVAPAPVTASNLVTDFSYLPIKANIKGTNTPLPVLILEEVIRKSTYRVITKTCTCRHAWDCKAYDKSMGCLHIGQATEEEPETVATSVSVEEAIDHVRKAVKIGLIPFIGRTEGDNQIWGVTAGKEFTTVCFCCPCCCIMFNTIKYNDPAAQAKVTSKLEGVTISIDETKCKGCGACVDKCLTGSMSLVNGKAQINEDQCRTCGRCANICFNDAIEVNIDNVENTVNTLLNRLDAKVGGFNMPEGFKLK